ncbi:unnamed protein product [Anisakis simplex]|uniref:Cyclin L (inferred by orthology to a C. elegans protein) n=1 Tax=Anisakis simplex TaxID=6269 RepID=A0A0M3JS94_ANISI|nr:unnamed protein product [Anisakis simplex]
MTKIESLLHSSNLLSQKSASSVELSAAAATARDHSSRPKQANGIPSAAVAAGLSAVVKKPDEATTANSAVANSAENSKIKPSSFGQRRLYSSIDISAEKWLLTLDEKSLAKLENPPSLADGLDRQTEQELRYLGCEIIQSGAIMLRLPQVAAATAQILYQRYYYQRSFVRQNFETAVMACLLLASKIEEAPRRPRDVINVFHRLEHLHGKRTESKKYVPMTLDKNYLSLKTSVINAERKLLNALGFVVHVRHPHKLIYAYLQALGCINNHELMQKAWSYMNDGLRTDIFVRYRPETIACACIYLAARTISKPIALPQQPFPWFEAFDASDRDVKAISMILLKLYTKTRAPNWLRLNEILTKIRFAPDSVFAKVRAAETQAQVDRDLEKKKREVARKILEMQRKENGAAGGSAKQRSKASPVPAATRQTSRQPAVDHRNSRDRDGVAGTRRARSASSSRSRSRSRSPIEPRKFRSSPPQASYERRRRGGTAATSPKDYADRRNDGLERVHQKHRHHRSSRRVKDDRRRAKEERRAERERKRSRSRDERRRAIEKVRVWVWIWERMSVTQREREKDVYLALGKRRQQSDSPEPIKYKR